MNLDSILSVDRIRHRSTCCSNTDIVSIIITRRHTLEVTEKHSAREYGQEHPDLNTTLVPLAENAALRIRLSVRGLGASSTCHGRDTVKRLFSRH